MSSQRRMKKATFALDEAVLEDAKPIVRKADYRSLNAFVEAAIVEKINRHRQQQKVSGLDF